MYNLFFLADFSAIKPDPGLILWTGLIFLIVYFVLARFAFKPIQEALKKREDDIQSSLDQAKQARLDMEQLQAKNEQLLIEAREERAKILKEAKTAKDTIISEAKEEAKEEAQKIVQNAKKEIENQRMAAIVDIKNQIGNISIEVAEKIIRKELKGEKEQEAFVKSLIDDAKLN